MPEAHNSIPSDRDVLEGTGRHPDEWFAFLDMAGASGWNLSEFEVWFANNAAEVSAGWRRSVISRYAAARGISAVG